MGAKGWQMGGGQRKQAERVLWRNWSKPRRLVWRALQVWHGWQRRNWIAVRRGGLRWRLHRAHDAIDRALLYQGSWEAAQLNHLGNWLARERAHMFLDVGAYFGLYALTMQNAFPALECHAFEPHTENCAKLQAQCARNSCGKRIHVHRLALGARPGAAQLWARADGQMAHVGIAARPAPAVKTETVAVQPLDAVLAVRGKCIALKIDVEGHELELLQGMTNLLQHNRVLMQMEVWNWRERRARIESFGLRLWGHIGQDYYLANFGGDAPPAPAP